LATTRTVLSKAGVADQVIDRLRREIANGSYPLGGRLPPVRQLADDFGVSQPTIREAVRALQSLGLVDVRHGSGVYVVANADSLMARSLSTIIQIQNVSILDVLDVRALLGRHTAERACRFATNEDLAAIMAALHRIQLGGDARTVTSAVADFQLCIAAASRSVLLFSLESFLIRLLIHFQLVAYGRRSADFWSEWTRRPNALRTELVDSLVARDTKRVAKAMTQYLAFQHDQFASDSKLSSLRISDPTWANAMTALADGRRMSD
jgi:GntR family transcriptional regulator, transcriptional repressor for pyruvate dehydrogenase complex